MLYNQVTNSTIISHARHLRKVNMFSEWSNSDSNMRQNRNPQRRARLVVNSSPWNSSDNEPLANKILRDVQNNVLDCTVIKQNTNVNTQVISVHSESIITDVTLHHAPIDASTNDSSISDLLIMLGTVIKKTYSLSQRPRFMDFRGKFRYPKIPKKTMKKVEIFS